MLIMDVFKYRTFLKIDVFIFKKNDELFFIKKEVMYIYDTTTTYLNQILRVF